MNKRTNEWGTTATAKKKSFRQSNEFLIPFENIVFPLRIFCLDAFLYDGSLCKIEKKKKHSHTHIHTQLNAPQHSKKHLLVWTLRWLVCVCSILCSFVCPLNCSLFKRIRMCYIQTQANTHTHTYIYRHLHSSVSIPRHGFTCKLKAVAKGNKHYNIGVYLFSHLFFLLLVRLANIIVMVSHGFYRCL